MTHIDLFTGLGGFALAARAAGFRTIVMCEADPFRRAGLASAWPGIPIVEDVRLFHWPVEGVDFDDRPSLLTAGVPCQPASRAGRQLGSRDDRWLWPEAVRVVAEAGPVWVVFENPPGIRDVGLDGICAQMENLGYEIGILDIPACAVGAPHIRHRYWIVAHSVEAGHQGRVAKRAQTGLRAERPAGHLDAWSDHVWIACADGKSRRGPHDAYGVVDGLPRKLFAALGDSIVPQVAWVILDAIARTETKAVP